MFAHYISIRVLNLCPREKLLNWYLEVIVKYSYYKKEAFLGVNKNVTFSCLYIITTLNYLSQEVLYQ